MIIETPLEIGQIVYYWWYGCVSCKPTVREGWHIGSGEIEYIKTETDWQKETSFNYFVDGTYHSDDEIFSTKKEARKHFKEHNCFYMRG